MAILPENTLRAALPQVARGFVMGAVDLVPGVSGGTAALVLGIYRHLVSSIHHCVNTVVSFLRGDVRGGMQGLRQIPLLWLGGLLVGILTVVVLLATPLEYALEEYPVPLAGLFAGLVLAAIILCWRQLQLPAAINWLLAAATAVATFFLLGLSPAGHGGLAPDQPLWVFFGAGAVAICAMILPGISGSFLLVLMGMYPLVIRAVAERDLPVLLVFALGCATGLGLAGSGLNWLLHHFHDAVIAAMVGLMVGSLRLLWPWPQGLGGTDLALPTADTVVLPVVLGLLGFALVTGADLLARRVGTRTGTS